MEFRTLNANEIEVRVGTASEKGVSLLLYKDARADMMLLDETVGAMNWQRYHSRDNANCTVAIYDVEKNAWITKEDTGTESNTEAEKGLASDSFKRACVNWGIGRELYTAPFIWVKAGENCEVKAKQGGRGYECKEKFVVSDIGYNERREINSLTIKNAKSGAVVFNMHRADTERAKPTQGKKEPEKQSTTTDDYTFVARCADCNKEISEKVHDYAVANFGRPLCRDCQRAQGSSEAAPKAEETAPSYRCERCGADIKPYTSPKNGKTVTAEAHAARSMAVYKGVLCLKCIEKKEAELKRVAEQFMRDSQ